MVSPSFDDLINSYAGEYYFWYMGGILKTIVALIMIPILIALFISLSKDSEKNIKGLITPYILIPFLLLSILASHSIMGGTSGIVTFLDNNWQNMSIGEINYLVIFVISTAVLTETLIKFNKIDLEILE